MIPAILARLREGLTVYESSPDAVEGSTVPSPTYPYVVVYPTSPMAEALAACDSHDREVHDFQTTVTGISPEQVRLAVNRVESLFRDWRPAVAGLNTSKVIHQGGQSVQPDEDIPDRTVFYATDQWRVVADVT